VDHLYQLREVHYPDGQALTVGYDLNGNRSKLAHPMGKGMMDTFALNGNRVTGGSTARKGWTVYRHDSRGNLSLEASFAWVADTGTLTNAWKVVESRFNKRNELVRARIINRQNGIDTSWLRFDYGEDGNRIASLVSKGNDTTSWTVLHRWVYDGPVITADSGSDHGWTWHAYNGLNRVAEATDSAGRARVRYVLTDHQGTVQALLSDTGAVLGHWVWDPWGNIEESWTQRTTDLLYQGKPYETALNQYQFNARWYSPERGEFSGRDAALQFWTPYSFVGNGPLTGTDLDGKVDASISGGAIWAVGGIGGVGGSGTLNVNAALAQVGSSELQNGNPVFGRSLLLAAKGLDFVDRIATFGRITDRSTQPVFSGSVDGTGGLGVVAGASVQLDLKLTLGTTGNKEIGGYGALAVKVGGHGELSLNFDDNGFSGISIGAGPNAGLIAGGGIIGSGPLQ
jgi:RHS repeat-associated protein